MGTGARIALGTWIAAALLCGVAGAVIQAATPTRVTTSDDRPPDDGTTGSTTRSGGTVPPLGGPFAPGTAVTGGGEGDGPGTGVTDATGPTTTIDPELTGGVHLEQAGTWVVAIDGTFGRLLTTGEEGGFLEWAAPGVLARPSAEGIVVVDLEAGERTVALGDGRRVTGAGFGGGRAVVGWIGGTGAGTSTTDLDLADERVLVDGHNASTIAVSAAGDAFTLATDGARSFDAAGRRRAGPVVLGSLLMGATWDPTGGWLALEVGDRIELVRGDLGDRRTVEAAGHGPGALTVAPGGTSVAYHASLGPTLDTGVFVAGPGRAPRLLAEAARDPAWHPAGGRVAYARTPWPERGRHRGEVRVTDVADGGTSRLASLGDGLTAENLRWSPDGTWLAMDVRPA